MLHVVHHPLQWEMRVDSRRERAGCRENTSDMTSRKFMALSTSRKELFIIILDLWGRRNFLYYARN